MAEAPYPVRVVKLEKHTAVLKREERTPSSFRFFFNEDEDGLARDLFVMAEDIYEDFGEPEEITITIERGDKLND